MIHSYSELISAREKGGLLAQRQDDLKEMAQPALFFTLLLAKRTVCVGMLQGRKFRLLVTELFICFKFCHSRNKPFSSCRGGNSISNFKCKVCSKKVSVYLSRCLGATAPLPHPLFIRKYWFVKMKGIQRNKAWQLVCLEELLDVWGHVEGQIRSKSVFEEGRMGNERGKEKTPLFISSMRSKNQSFVLFFWAVEDSDSVLWSF